MKEYMESAQIDNDILTNKDEIIYESEKLYFNYDYIFNNFIFKIFSNFIYYVIALPILKVLTKIVYDLKIEGRENLKNINSGIITVSNHVLVLDCAMIGIACASKKVYFTTQEESFEIPFVRKLIKYLNAIPIPKSISNKRYFIKTINKLLQDKNIVHFYPEGELYPYSDKLRKFRNGAFDFSIKNNIPIVPIVYTFREPKGIRKIFKHKKDVTMTILKPVFPNNYDTKENKSEAIKEEIFNKMKNCI